MMLLLLIAVSILGYAVYVAANAATSPAREQELSVARAARYGLAQVRARDPELLRFRERVITPAVYRLAAVALRVNPRVTLELIGTRLMGAGLSSRFTATQFLALKSGLTAGGLILFGILGFAASPTGGILLTLIGGVFGFMLPDTYLTMRTRARRELVRAQLPDALDVLAVSVEAGLGLDGAIVKLTEHMQGPLIDEFALTLGEIRIGESRHEALKKLTERVPTPEVAAFVRSVIQADQLGISLGRILRVQAADSRLRRQAAAEEKAMKAPIKMLFPTVLFIFPSLFLVILGPAMLNISHFFHHQ
jgi:tight adherence protein C